MVYIFNNYPNIEVTNFYLDVISKGIENAGYAVEKIPFVGRKSNGKLSLFRNLLFHDFGYKKLPKKAWIVVANPADAVNLRIHGYTNIILWAQGVSPEESYMTNGSMISKLFLEIIEKLSLNFSRFTFLVSNAMKEHYEKKYKIDFGQSCFIMPCFNSTLDLQSFEYPQKYENNIFTYVGSTAAWQCFKETISLYKQLFST